MKATTKPVTSSKSARETAKLRMRTWRKNNPAHARRLDRRARWRKLGYTNYEGEAKGGMTVSIEVQRQVRDLRKQLNTWNYEYYVLNFSSVTDAEYDRAYDALKQLEKANPDLYDPNSPTERVGAVAVATLDKVRHVLPMLSLEKVKTAEDVTRFFRCNAAGVMEPKVDGLSLEAAYVNGRLAQAVTRGDGQFGQDVTLNARTIRSLPLVLRRSATVRVRGEVFIKWSAFTALNKAKEARGEELSAHPRTDAAGAMSLKRPADAAQVPLSFIAYSLVKVPEGENVTTHTEELELLEELGFLTTLTLPPPLADCESMFQSDFAMDNAVEIADRLARLEKARRVQDLPTDGVVLKLDDLALQAKFGITAKHPRWAVAYKFAPDRVKTRIQSITWTVGKSGKITPVALFDPVILGGATVERATLFNGAEIVRLNVNVGDDVMVEKCNEIIPNVMELAVKRSKGPAAIPTTCPACGSKLVQPEGVVDTYCAAIECSAQAEARLVYATGKSGLDIEGCGNTTVKLLLANDINTLAKLLLERDFAFLKGALRKTMQAGVIKAQSAPFWRKLAALCIDGWGKQTCQAVASVFPTINLVIEAYAADDATTSLLSVVGSSKLHGFVSFMETSYPDVERLMNAGFFPAVAEAEAESGVQGKSFCITGSLPGVSSRIEAENQIVKRGGLVKGSVTRNLSYLVVGNDAGATKSDAAKRWGTVCLTPDEFFDMLDWRPKAVTGEGGAEY